MKENRIAIVTGATRGIGKQIARELASSGVFVICTGRSGQKGAEVVESICQQGGKAVFFALDLSRSTSLDSFAEKVAKTYGRLDVLVHNAGISGPMGPIESSPREEVEKVMQVNVQGVYLLTQRLIPLLKHSDSGRIVMVSSIAYRLNPAHSGAYNMSKAAMNALAATLAKELGPAGITVNTVAPGLVLTDRIRNERIPGMAQKAGISEEQMQQSLTKDTLTNRLTTESDVANAVAFLASERASSVTGQVLNVSAGM